MGRIRYADPEEIDDPELRAELERAMLHSTPRPEIQAVRARQPELEALWAPVARRWAALVQARAVTRPG